MAFNLKNLEQMPRSTTGNNFKYVTDDDRYTVSQAGYFDLSSVTLNNPGNATINCLCPNHSFVAIVSSDGDCLVKLADRTYQYFTADTIADVTASGYFTGKNYSFDADESIKVQASDGPYEVQLVGGVASVVGGISKQPKASGYLMSKLNGDLSDATVLMISDSTGNEDFESLYLLSQWYASSFPSYTVNYYLWDVNNDIYLAPEVLQVGTGSHTLSIYNAAKPGSRPSYFMASRFGAAIRDIPQADLVIYNHGHNIGNDTAWNSDNYQDDRVMLHVSAAMQVMEVHAGAGLLVCSQNPLRDDETRKPYYDTLSKFASMMNADITDSYERFEKAGKAPEYYNDNTHPSALGHSELVLPSLIDQHTSLIGKAALNPLSMLGNNLLVNGDFSAFSGAIPDDWDDGNIVTTKDTTNYESENGYSVLLQYSGSGSSSYIRQNVAASLLPRLAGKRVTLAARRRIPSGEPATAGRVRLRYTTASLNVTIQSREYTQGTDGNNGFEWVSVSCIVPANPTLLQVILMADSTTTDGEANFDRVMLCVGELPKDTPLS